MSEAGTLRIISGVGAKGPACFLLEAQGKRLMLDLGYGPQPGLWPNVDDVGRVDALLLSHSHKDHIGGLSLLPKIGNPPIFATEITAKKLPAGTKVHPLPLNGRGDVLGIPVDTGRNGHAPGGIWMRFHGGTGLLYTGDYSTKSALYAFDTLPEIAHRAVRLLLWRRRHAAGRAAQDRSAPHLADDVLLPAPADGRGPDIALHLYRAGKTIRFDDATRAAVRDLTGIARGYLRDGVEEDLAQLAEAALPAGEPSGATFSTAADGSGGTTAKLIAQWEKQAAARDRVHRLHPARLARRSPGEGRPREIPALERASAALRHARVGAATGAATLIPAFCDSKFLPALQAALKPANVTMDKVLTLV